MELTKYCYVVRTTWMNSLAYVMDFVGSSFFMAILMFVFISLWTTIYGGGSVIDGFTLPMMIWYLVMSESIIFSDSRVADEISQEVKSGHLAYSLNKPYNYVLFKYSQYIGRAFMRFFVAFLTGAIITLLFVGPINLSPATILVPIIILAAISLNFLFFVIIGLLAFWFEDTKSFQLIYSKIIFTLGGMLIPLEFYPGWLEKLSLSLPFATVPYFPARLFVNFTADLFTKALILQFFWGCILILIITLIYVKASKKVQIHGG
ncbi:MAG: ABC transporter permease [Candidatus Woesearchaeota archaeon]